ncbi:MAG: cadherin-like domain-containing protein [Lentisphaeria bacterium]|nr:cadherin-like domain-containing protein [Lentisphaeria bacterium]
MQANGDYTYDPNGQFESAAVGETLTDSFVYRINDGNSGTDTATLQINITGTNNLPVAADDAIATDEASTVAGNVITTSDSDPDTSDVLVVINVNDGSSYAIAATGTTTITLASGALLYMQADGNFTYDPNGQYETLALGETNTDSFVYTIDDGNSGTDTATVTVTINGLNDAPVAGDDSYLDDENYITDEETLIEGNLITGTDADTDVTDVLAVTNIQSDGANAVAASGSTEIELASGALLTMQANGDFEYDPNAAFDDLELGQTATDTFVYTIDDGNGGTDTATVTIQITGITDPIVNESEVIPVSTPSQEPLVFIPTYYPQIYTPILQTNNSSRYFEFDNAVTQNPQNYVPYYANPVGDNSGFVYDESIYWPSTDRVNELLDNIFANDQEDEEDDSILSPDESDASQDDANAFLDANILDDVVEAE